MPSGSRVATSAMLRSMRQCMKDLALNAFYTKKARELKLPNGYTAALTDYMRKGRIESVNRKQYGGKAGGRITIVARKQGFHLKEVKVILETTTGELVEQGLAARVHDGNWVYRNKVAVADAQTVVLRITAADFPGRVVG